MLGAHIIKSWSVNQAVVALSSGEAEYYGMVKGASNALGINSMLRDMGITANVALFTDSSAAKGIASRRGLGKIRHIEVNQLWLQDQVARNKIQLFKVRGEDNFADSLTKHAGTERVSQTMRCCNQCSVRGRHPLMPSVAEDAN